ncbi:MAG: beta-ketoacyl-[acyl-carrier-protein] synthase family protein [Neomegalonema sp.]|nr:beta-ketoacyl-[acyl-carrier-protein] synthase family protein [Neomegalonema sp.]
MTRRVAVTGLGVVSSLGVGTRAHFAGLREGRSGIGPIELIETQGLSVPIAAEAKAFDGAAYFSKSELMMRDRVTQMALVAGEEAMAQAGLASGTAAGADGAQAQVDEALGVRSGVVIGTSIGGSQTVDEQYRLLYGERKNRVHPFTVPRLMANAPCSHLSMRFGLMGPSWTVSTACSSSNHALAQAFQMVRSGAVDVMLAGGSEASLTFGVLKGWEGLRVMAKDACRPFSKNRSGMVQGEGAAILVLEDMAHAQARGADIIAEIIGCGMSSDASDIVKPSQDGAARAMVWTLKDAGINPEDIDYINAHGTATAVNDSTETAAIRQVFGVHADALAVSSTKSMHGHCIGAAGALEAAATLLAVRENLIPPTINYEEPDPECDLDVTPNTARERQVSVAMSNTFAFGGLNAVLAFRAV